MMSGLSLAVLEKKPRWVPELKRRFLGTATSVRGFSSARELREAVSAGTHVVILVLEELEEACLNLLGRFQRRSSPPLTVVVCSENNADLEWPIRELGVVAFVKNDKASDEMVAICRRLLKSL